MSESERPPSRPEEERRRVYELVERERSQLPAGLLIAGLAAFGLGLLAWYYIVPDLKRYMKIRNM
jgi:hypothetical protein